MKNYDVTSGMACVVSVSVGLRSKERRGTGFFAQTKHWKFRSSVFLCSSTPRKRLLRRLQVVHAPLGFWDSITDVCLFFKKYRIALLLPIASLHIFEAIKNFGPSTNRSNVQIKKQPIRNLLIWPFLANQHLWYNRRNLRDLAQRKIARLPCLQVSCGTFFVSLGSLLCSSRPWSFRWQRK